MAGRKIHLIVLGVSIWAALSTLLPTIRVLTFAILVPALIWKYQSLNAAWKKLSPLSKICVATCVTVVGVLGIVFIGSGHDAWNRRLASEKSQQDQFYRQQKIQRLSRLISISKRLKTYLRNEGVNEALIVDVKTHEESEHIVVIVSNTWLARPDHEKIQFRQTISLLLKQLTPPDGAPFVLWDYMGNEVK